MCSTCTISQMARIAKIVKNKTNTDINIAMIFFARFILFEFIILDWIIIGKNGKLEKKLC